MRVFAYEKDPWRYTPQHLTTVVAPIVTARADRVSVVAPGVTNPARSRAIESPRASAEYLTSSLRVWRRMTASVAAIHAPSSPAIVVNACVCAVPMRQTNPHGPNCSNHSRICAARVEPRGSPNTSCISMSVAIARSASMSASGALPCAVAWWRTRGARRPRSARARTGSDRVIGQHARASDLRYRGCMSPIICRMNPLGTSDAISTVSIPRLWPHSVSTRRAVARSLTQIPYSSRARWC